MRIRLTEAQAWETLARFFERRTQAFHTAAGLCSQTNSMEFRYWITPDISYRMFDVINSAESLHSPTDHGYFWPRNRAGAQARARFCWRQVKRLRGR